MVSWYCAFLLPLGKIRFGKISQDRGCELVDFIKAEQRLKGSTYIPITIHNTTDNIPFVVLDILVMQVEEVDDY